MPWPEPLLAVYASAELILALQISLSNFVVILVYLRSKHIRTPTNAYIFSLAMTDFLAGALGIPFTVASVLTRWPGSYYACLAIHLILCVLCTVSTLHLLAMAVDKYLTICLKRFDHQRTSSSSSARKSRANFLIVSAWISGAAIAGLPMIDGFGFASRTIGNFRGQCHFTVVVDYRYLVFVIFFGTIILPSVVIAYCYMSIYSHIRNEERQIKCLLRASERQRRINARRKLIRILLILVLTYACCWYPLYLINTVDLFLPTRFHAGPYMTLAAVVLSHLNCALNPVIYAYGVPGFKHSLRRFLPLKLATHCAQQQRGVLPYTGTSSHQQHCGPLFPPLKSPFLGSNGLPMGAKRTGMLVVQQQQQPSSAATRQHQVNYRRMAPVGKFSRAISTMDAIPPTHCGARMPLAGKQSSQSLLETRRQQFRQRNDRSQQQQQHLDEQRRRRSTTVDTETDDHSAGEEALSSGEQATAATEHSSGCEHANGGGIGTTGGGKLSHSSADSSCLSASGDVPTTEKVPMPKQQRPQSASVASRVSWLSLLIFNGHWLMKKRKTSSREEATGGGAQQRWSLADGDGIGLVEGRLMGEEESG